MPLIEGKSDETRAENIRREIESGRSPEQAAAIAYRTQREARAADVATYVLDDAGVRQALDALHQCADACMAYGRK